MKIKQEYIVARVEGLPCVIHLTRDTKTIKMFRRCKIDLPKKYSIKTHRSFLAKVPVVMTTVPEIPDAISLGKNVFVRISSQPLTYRWVSIWKATKVKAK